MSRHFEIALSDLQDKIEEEEDQTERLILRLVEMLFVKHSMGKYYDFEREVRKFAERLRLEAKP